MGWIKKVLIITIIFIIIATNIVYFLFYKNYTVDLKQVSEVRLSNYGINDLNFSKFKFFPSPIWGGIQGYEEMPDDLQFLIPEFERLNINFDEYDIILSKDREIKKMEFENSRQFPYFKEKPNAVKTYMSKEVNEGVLYIYIAPKLEGSLRYMPNFKRMNTEYIER